MRSLDDLLRTKLLRTAIFLCAIALLLAPLAGRSSMVLQPGRITTDQPFNSKILTQKQSTPSVAIYRDPFVAPNQGPAKATPPVSEATRVVGMTVRQGDPMGYPVPGGPAEAPASIVVRAIVSGANPSALVDETGRPRVVQIGDTLGGVAVLRIDPSGVTLKDGRRITIDENAQ